MAVLPPSTEEHQVEAQEVRCARASPPVAILGPMPWAVAEAALEQPLRPPRWLLPTAAWWRMRLVWTTKGVKIFTQRLRNNLLRYHQESNSSFTTNLIIEQERQRIQL